MIEVGEYGRTNKGKIFIFSWVVDDKGQKVNYILKFVNGGPVKYYLEKGEEIVNHSKNIIDLIEVGDYVNGSKLISIDYAEDEFGNCDKLHFYYHFEDEEKDVNEYYEKLNIKGILTKEQFASMEYKVKEE